MVLFEVYNNVSSELTLWVFLMLQSIANVSKCYVSYIFLCKWEDQRQKANTAI